MKSSILLILISTVSFSFNSCKEKPFFPNFEHAGGYVIGKELCKANPNEDYWLVDLSYVDNPPNLNYGDTITVNGIFYSHMIKTKQLLSDFKIVGKKVSFDFRLSGNKISTTGCTVANPITFNLKEMEILASGEIR